MATVAELSDPYANFMRNPLPPEAPDVCSVCLTFTSGFDTCYRCGHQPRFADRVLPISYSVHFGQLHTALAGYKRSDQQRVALRFKLELAAVLWRFLSAHEACLATAVGANEFSVVTTVPSSSPERDLHQPLREIVGSIVHPTAGRYIRALQPSADHGAGRAVNPDKFELIGPVDGAHVLLIDDTWTTGSNIQSAAGRLKDGGAASVGAVVIGRHIHADFATNEARLSELPRRYDWSSCGLE